MIDFKLPELGENVTAGDVLRVLVKAGDTLAKDQPVLELETDKATIEVPSSVGGQVKEIKVKAGDNVKVGQSILSIEEDGAGSTAEDTGAPRDEARAAAPVPATGEAAKPVGQEPEPPKRETTQPESTKPEAPQQAGSEDARAAAQSRANNVVDISRGARAPAGSTTAELPVAPAAPSVRKLARELGVDIDQVPGTGPDGRISIDDVKSYTKRLVTAPAAPARPGGAPLPDFSRWGPIDRQPMRAVRRKTAEHLSVAWSEIPHVTQHDYADITGLEELRHRYAKQAEAAGGALTITAIAVKVVASALKRFPQFNVSIDMAASEIVFKKYVNIGIAVDTDRGLLVPVIRGADTKNIMQISVELTELSDKARTRKISLEEMQGGCFSISNLGGIGGSFFTPIVNTPEVAILGISRAKMEPVHDAQGGGFVPRLMLPLSLSYDHRVIDGADAIRFLRWIVEAFERPFLLALQG